MLEIEKQSIDNKLVAGTRWEISEASNSYSPSDYKLVYTFSTQTGFVKAFETTSDNNKHLLVINPDETSTFLAGYYNVSITAKSLTDNNKIYHVASVVVFINATSGISATVVSYYVQMIEKLEKTILSLANKTMSSVNLDGITYTYRDIDKLENLLNYYKDKAGLNNKLKNKVFITFTN